MNLKYGFPIAEYIDAPKRRILEFLVSILYPKKSTRVTIIVGNMIFEALEEERLVDWGIVFKNMPHKLACEVRKSKPISIFPYLFHLYHSLEILKNKELVD